MHATATFGFTEALHRYAQALSGAEKDAAFAEGARRSGQLARLGGAAGGQRLPGLEGSPILTDFLRIMDAVPILPAPLPWLQRLLVRGAVQIRPESVRSLARMAARLLLATRPRCRRPGGLRPAPVPACNPTSGRADS